MIFYNVYTEYTNKPGVDYKDNGELVASALSTMSKQPPTLVIIMHAHHV